MNLDKKLELAHEYAMGILKDTSYNEQTPMDILAEGSWKYADAMEVGYNKRKQSKAEKDAEESKVIFKSLMKNEDGSCKHFHTTLNGSECFDCGEKLNIMDSSQLDDCDHHWKEFQDHKVCKICNKQEGYIPWGGFQPDWSVAPERATAWKIDDHGVPMWLQSHNNINQPYVWLSDAPNFDYQGDWKDSLRKRPK